MTLIYELGGEIPLFHFCPFIASLNRYNHQIDKPLNIKIKMLFFLGSVLFLVIGLPLLFYMLGHGEAYVTWGPWISAIALMLWLLLDVDKIRRGGGR
ncbi:hypothetical protein [Aeromonas hydrophila]|uniref:hypothetical protein n=1 Tax=Aeromonas hydrophila TaxID=644 RepID=UPI00301B060B